MSFRIFISIFSACILLLFSGCQKRQEPEKIQITFMHGWNGSSRDHQIMRSIYRDFEKRHPDSELIIDALPDVSIVIEKATDMLAVDRVPDIISTNGWGNYAENSVLKKTALNLSPFIKADPEFLACLPEEITARILRGEAIYTIPDVTEMQGFWYNASILSAAGIAGEKNAHSVLCRSWDEFFKLCAAVKRYAAGSGSNVVPFVLHNEQYLSLFGAVLGGSALRELSSNADSENPPAAARFFDKTVLTAGLRKLKEITSYAEISAGTAGIKDAREAFLRGESAFFFNGVWDSVALNNSPVSKSVHHVPYPSETGKTVAYRFLPSGYVLANRGGADKIRCAAAFLKYMVSIQVQRRIACETLQVPVNPNVDISSSETNPLFAEACANIKQAEIPIEGMHRIWPLAAVSYFLAHIDDYLQGRLPAQEMADNIAAHF